MILRQSTAKAVSFGPFVDKTDGVTPEVGLVSALDHVSTGILLSKNGAALTIRHATVTATTYDAYGNYIVTLDTTDTNTVGTLRMQFIETATCLPVWLDFNIVEEAVYDELFAASALGYVANAPVTLADAVAHGGTLGSSTATLALSRMNVTSQTSNTVGLTVAGNGSGAGASVTGGATGNALTLVGGGTSGNGIGITTTSGHGISSVATGTTKHGIHAVGGATTSHGINALGGGVGHGILATSGGGATGNGITATAASTNGNGFATAGVGTGAGLRADGGATGNGLTVNSGGSGGYGVAVLAVSDGMNVTSWGTGHGMNLVGSSGGSGSGLSATGDGTGHGIQATSGTGATGNGINATSASTNGNGLSTTGTGTGNGVIATGGAGAGGDGIQATAGGGVDIRGNITGNLVGTVSTLTTYTGNTPQTGDTYALANGAAGFVAIAGYIDTEVAAIKAKTDLIPAAPASTTNITAASGVALTSAYDFAKGTVAVTESYNADGAAPTPVQALMMILQMLTEKSVASTTLTVKKLDGSTSAATFTLNDGTTPTAITRAS